MSGICQLAWWQSHTFICPVDFLCSGFRSTLSPLLCLITLFLLLLLLLLLSLYLCHCDVSQMKYRTQYIFVIWSCIRINGEVSESKASLSIPPYTQTHTHTSRFPITVPMRFLCCSFFLCASVVHMWHLCCLYSFLISPSFEEGCSSWLWNFPWVSSHIFTCNACKHILATAMIPGSNMARSSSFILRFSLWCNAST